MSDAAVIAHRCCWTRVHRDGRSPCRLRVVFEIRSGRPPTPFAPLVAYFLEHDAVRRPSWQKEVVRAVRRLLDYGTANERSPKTVAPQHLLSRFTDALLHGTVDEAGADPSGLFWQPLTRPVAHRTLHLVTEFTDWLANRTGEAPLNPLRRATSAEQLANVRRLNRRTSRSLLAHASYRRPALADTHRTRSVRIDLGDRDGETEICAFDRCRFGPLLLQGFGLSRRRPSVRSVRNALIAILLHGGGLRICEPFHLWCEDVNVDPDRPASALVRLFHPTDGQAPIGPDGQRWRNRGHCLKEHWKLDPRHQQTLRRFNAGWKHLQLTDHHRQFAQVHWFPTFWGEVFLALYRRYVSLRPKVTTHPYLFLSDRKPQRGAPYTVDAFWEAHQVAVRRIGLDASKYDGTTPHAHRHAYAEALVEAGLDELTIQTFLHHRSIHSQEVYTQRARQRAAVNQLHDALKQAGEAMAPELRGLLEW